MKTIIGYIKNYVLEVNKIFLLLVTAFIATLIFFNYNYKLLKWLTDFPVPFPRFAGFYLLFLFCLCTAYILYSLTTKKNIFKQRNFLLLIFIAPAIYALKMAVKVNLHFTSDPFWNVYLNKIIYWPIIFITLFIFLLIIWKIQGDVRESFYGLAVKKINWKPYVMMILLMVPVIVFVSMQPEFLQTYPKIKTILPFPAAVESQWFYKILYELAYGIDFLTVELFFRGFLVLAFIKYAGKDAILPMAIFYCAIHFGKPLAECISSYFGGILLGIIVYHTRTILGGLFVHVAIAWLMEACGYLANLMK